MRLKPGDEIDRYRVVRAIGKGGMAEVYLTEHRTLGTQHALKVLTLLSENVRDRLIQEGRVQANLKHPNLVAVTDVFDINGVPGLLMEYIDGPSLYKWLHDNPRTVEQAVEIFQGILSGVRRAHEAGVIHRDLKPDNVLMATKNGRLIPKVTDFGLAKALEVDDPQMRQTRSGMSMGTPAYMAPEQIRDAKNVDARADIFALGCILYELVAAKRAFDGGDALDIMNSTSQGNYVSLTEIVPDLPERITKVVHGCLVPDPSRRIPNCAYLAAVLSGEQSWPPKQSAPEQGAHTVGEIAALPGWTDQKPAQTGIPGMQGQVIVPNQAQDHRRSVLTRILNEKTQPPTVDYDQSLDQPLFSSGAPASEKSPWLMRLGVAAGLMLIAFVWSINNQPAAPETAAPLPAQQPVTPTVEPPVPEPAEAPETVNTKAAEAPPVEAPVRPPTKPAPTKANKTPPPPASTQATPKAPPAPSAVPANTGIVRFTGADGIRLTANGKSFQSGPVPAGTYQIEARFGAREVSAGTVRIIQGETLTLKCDADFEMCGR